jgi:hypothetical protein
MNPAKMLTARLTVISVSFEFEGANALFVELACGEDDETLQKTQLLQKI